jgi:hypothetical protein
LFVVIVVVLTLLFYLLFKVKKLTQDQAEKIALIEDKLASENTKVALFSSAAMGVDGRVLSLELRLSELECALEESESKEKGDASYHSAIRQAKSGSDRESLVKECNISREEADLIVRLYGSDD